MDTSKTPRWRKSEAELAEERELERLERATERHPKFKEMQEKIEARFKTSNRLAAENMANSPSLMLFKNPLPPEALKILDEALPSSEPPT